MNKRGLATRVLATMGTFLVWLPIAAPVLLAVVGAVGRRGFRFDYLMPAELFPVALVGAALLLWAALRARSRRRLIGWGLALMLGFLVAGQGLAVGTGLASGEAERVGWPWVVVIASLVGYTLALAVVGIAGVLLMGDVFRRGDNGGR